MKLATVVFISFTWMFIGCGGQELPNPHTPPPNPPAPGEDDVVSILEPNAASQTVLTCSKDGADSVVYTAKTYKSPQPCKKDEGLANVRSCLCEVFFEDNVLFMATETQEWCEDNAINGLMNSQGMTVYGSRGAEFVKAKHDASYTCTSS